jgi:hypothetical protein
VRQQFRQLTKPPSKEPAHHNQNPLLPTNYVTEHPASLEGEWTISKLRGRKFIEFRSIEVIAAAPPLIVGDNCCPMSRYALSKPSLIQSRIANRR